MIFMQQEKEHVNGIMQAGHAVATGAGAIITTLENEPLNMEKKIIKI